MDAAKGRNHAMLDHLAAWRSAWQDRKAAAGRKARGRELEFLPAALEVQDSPPHPIARAIGGTIIAFFAIAVLWAVFGEVDIVAVAEGKIVPSGRSKLIHPLEIGVVRAIHVEDGQPVKRGDPLIDLDLTTMQADQERLRAEWMGAKAGLARVVALRRALAKSGVNAEAFFEPPDEVDDAILRVQKDLLRSQFRGHRAQQAALATECAKKEAEYAAIGEKIKKHEQVIPLISKRTESRKSLSERQLLPESEYLTAEQERIEHVQDLAALRNRLTETAEAIKQAKAQGQSLQAEFENALLSEQAELEGRIAALKQERIKAESRTGLQRLKAPVDGVVQQLAVHTLGGVVTPAQPLMVIVPDAHRLEVEAYVRNKDIGFVEEGQQAEVKIAAFPFTKYGTIDAELLNVSNDAIENKTLGWVFAARVLLKQSAIQVEDKRVNLTPGMSVSVEVKTGKRRLIEFFMSPLLRYRQESIKER